MFIFEGEQRNPGRTCLAIYIFRIISENWEVGQGRPQEFL